LLLLLPSEGEWQAVLAQLEDRLDEANARTFWRDAQTTLDLGARAVAAADLEALVGRLKNAYGLVPVGVVSSNRSTREEVDKLGLAAHEELPVPRKPVRAPAAPASNALLLRQTMRSGQRVVHEGHLVICGDVNAGAEVIAEGDIVVIGTLRGVAHAGCFGDEAARIVAMNLRPTQLRIAGYIARSPDTGQHPQGRFPEVARIENGDIHISPL
jgi:septum site-determining protein MinC